MTKPKLLFAQLPNALSVARLGLGLVFPLLDARWRLPVIIVACLTEWADGAIARRFGLASKLGSYLDPIADKVFVGMVLLTLVLEERLRWYEALLIVGRDLVVIYASIYYALRGQGKKVGAMRPSFAGKLATALQLALMLALVNDITYPPLIYATAFVSIYAGVDYIQGFKHRQAAMQQQV